MGVHSRQLAPQLVDLARLASGDRALDVGCGPGALTTELVTRLGAGSVAAVDPSESFVVAARARHTGVDVRRASAEGLPYADRVFDAGLAQLVVHFMTDPVPACARWRESREARVPSWRPSGITPASGRRCPRSGGRLATSASRRGTSPRWLAPAEVILSSSSRGPVCVMSRTRSSWRASSTRASMSGGSPSAMASGLLVLPTWR